MSVSTNIGAVLKRHLLWAGLGLVLIPLLIILGLQYMSLSKLEKTSPAARKMYLKDFLYSVALDAGNYYREHAARALDLPTGTLREKSMNGVRAHFRQHAFKGVQQFFVVVFDPNQEVPVLLYDAERDCLEHCSVSAQARSINIAVAPWRQLNREGRMMSSPALAAEERDPEFRMILKPLVDESWRIAGVSGLIVDPVFLKKEFLPKAIAAAVPKYFSDTSRDNIIVTVRDAEGRLGWATERPKTTTDEVFMNFPFVFKDWRLGLQNKDMTIEQWAEWGFAVNLSLSVLMTLVLVAGIIFALRMASREMRLTQMKSEFVSNVSHELRTPLASIRVFGEFLRLGRVTEPAKVEEYGKYIETESRRLTQLINNILDFSKIESGRKTYEFTRADVGEIVQETLKTFEVRLKESGFQIRYEPPAAPLPPLLLDSSAIGQALTNLLDNAVKYSGESRQVSVQLRAQSGLLAISVSDQGVGLQPCEQEKIFEKFYRVSTGLVHDVKGSGLGLSIVKHVVEAHRGRVTVESEPGRGSTFTILLPMDERLGSLPSRANTSRISTAKQTLGLDPKA